MQTETTKRTVQDRKAEIDSPQKQRPVPLQHTNSLKDNARQRSNSCVAPIIGDLVFTCVLQRGVELREEIACRCRLRSARNKQRTTGTEMSKSVSAASEQRARKANADARYIAIRRTCRLRTMCTREQKGQLPLPHAHQDTGATQQRDVQIAAGVITVQSCARISRTHRRAPTRKEHQSGPATG